MSDDIVVGDRTYYRNVDGVWLWERADGTSWRCNNPELLDEIERLRAEAKRPEDIGMVLERNVMVDVAGVTIRCRAVEDLWRFPGELEDSYDARHEDSAGDDDSGGDAGTDGRDVGDGVPVPGGVRADRVRQGLPDRYPWGDLDADPDTLPFTDPRGDADTYADHHANHYIDPYGDTAR